MPIMVTVEPNENTRAETIMYANGMPMLAVNDTSASVMFTPSPSMDGARVAGEWASRLMHAARQFQHECLRQSRPASGLVHRDFSNSGPGIGSIMSGRVDGGDH